jgi:hypothetical protein
MPTMDVDEFYEQDPRRQASDELEFGRDWYEGDMRFEVAWVADTGELYAMAEPYSRRGITTEAVTVEILGVVQGRDAVRAALAGWEDAMVQPDGLAWVRSRVGATSGGASSE